MSKMSPKSTINDEEGVAYMAEELALEAEGSGPVRVSRMSVFCEDDDEACDFVGGGFFAMPEVIEIEQEDAEDAGDALGAMQMAGDAESKAGVLLESSGGSEDVKPVVESVDSTGIGPNAWNEHISTVVCDKEVYVRASSCAEPCDMGWTVEGAVLMPETSVSTESVGVMPCNALSMPKEAAVIAKTCDVALGCAELKADAPAVGWATGRVCTTQILPLLLETEGMTPCEAENVKDDVSKPSGYTGMFGISTYSGPGMRQEQLCMVLKTSMVSGPIQRSMVMCNTYRWMSPGHSQTRETWYKVYRWISVQYRHSGRVTQSPIRHTTCWGPGGHCR
jgi:hypothetical protein